MGIPGAEFIRPAHARRYQARECDGGLPCHALLLTGTAGALARSFAGVNVVLSIQYLFALGADCGRGRPRSQYEIAYIKETPNGVTTTNSRPALLV